MVDKLVVSIDPANSNLPQLDKDLGTIGPGGVNVWARVVATIPTTGTSAASTIADGADVAEGALADAVVNAGATGSVSAKLRRLTTDLDAQNTLIGAVAAAAVLDGDGSVNAHLRGLNHMATDEGLRVQLPGALKTLLASTTITSDATTAYTAVTGLELYSKASVVLTVSGKVMDASTVLNIFIQRSLDAGVTWDDIASFSQLTSAAIGDGVYVMDLILSGSSQIDRVQRDATLTANTIATVGSWGDRLRVKKISANFAGSDSVTIVLTAYMVP
jgi:hypothetical protein